MHNLNTHKVGLIFGSFAALMHLLWSLLVFAGLAQAWIDFVFGMHFLNNPYTVEPFSWGTALGVILIAFVMAYLGGFIFATIWNRLHR